MTITTTAGGNARSLHAPAHDNLETLEIALSEEEIANATILEFDPEASVSFCSRPPLAGDEPAFHAIPGHYYSRATWSRLAAGALGGRPSDALARFLRLRAAIPADDRQPPPRSSSPAMGTPTEWRALVAAIPFFGTRPATQTSGWQGHILPK